MSSMMKCPTLWSYADFLLLSNSTKKDGSTNKDAKALSYNTGGTQNVPRLSKKKHLTSVHLEVCV